jgi:hypothetical protein
MLSRSFLFRTWMLVWGIRLGLWLLPFGKMRRIVANLAQPPTEADHPQWPMPGQIAWAVTVTSRYIPQATCLTQAMTTRILLGRYGHPATLRIGVARGEEDNFQAHAWVESNGTVVIGGAEAELAEKYVMLPALEVES